MCQVRRRPETRLAALAVPIDSCASLECARGKESWPCYKGRGLSCRSRNRSDGEVVFNKNPRRRYIRQLHYIARRCSLRCFVTGTDSYSQWLGAYSVCANPLPMKLMEINLSSTWEYLFAGERAAIRAISRPNHALDRSCAIYVLRDNFASNRASLSGLS